MLTLDGMVGTVTSDTDDLDATTPDLDPASPKNPLVLGSVEAHALHAIYSGERAVIVQSPPGAGKSTLVARLVARMVEHSDPRIVIATPTRDAAADIAERLAAALGWQEGQAPAVRLNVTRYPKTIPGVATVGATQQKQIQVTVRTAASCVRNPPECDLMVFDEAYQVTYATLCAAADSAPQILLVGDPGQIGPVIRANTTAYDSGRHRPHFRAPEGLMLPSSPVDPVVLSLTETHRLGQATVDTIAPLYSFGFTSLRPDRTVTTVAGETLPEIRHTQVPVGEKDDLATMRVCATTAIDLIGSTLTTVLPDGGVETLDVTAADVAVVVAHRAQRGLIEAFCEQAGHPGVKVGTADSLQGGQWAAVVALDPTVGHPDARQHQLTPGRLCVMASRHTAHLTWVHDGTWEASLGAVASSRDVSAEERDNARKGLQVRRRIAR